MVTPTPSWNTVRVHGTWLNFDGSMKAGTYKVTMPIRVTNATDDVIIPKGVFASGPLNTTSGLPSLDVQVLASDDPDNAPSGFQPIIEITFIDAPGELYALDIPVALSGNANGINLRQVVLTQSLPAPTPVLIRGVAGGLAELDAQGFVIDAAGNRVTGGAAGALIATNNLSDVPNKATARTNLGLGTASTHPAGDFLTAPTGGTDGQVLTKSGTSAVWAAATGGGTGGGVTVTDNNDGTATVTATAPNTVTDNNDGTATIAA